MPKKHQASENIPLSPSTPVTAYGSTAINSQTNSLENIANPINQSIENTDITDSNVYANFFRQKFREDFPDEFNFSIGLAGGSMNAFKF